MSKVKVERAGSDIQKELSNIIFLEAKDEDFKNVVITGVEVSNDLSFAKVYFTTTDDIEHVTKDLNNAASFFRTLLSQRLEMRHTPELKFIFDESIEYGQKIENIIKELHKED